MASRYELTEVQWSCLQDLLPGRKQSVGRPAKGNRTFGKGVLWAVRAGARWRDRPERYGKYKSGPKRFPRGAASGVWERLLRPLTPEQSNP
jgi:transposase